MTKLAFVASLAAEIAPSGTFFAAKDPKIMARTVQIDEAQALFSDLIANVEAGEEILITRGSQPVARLSNFARPRNLEKIVAEVNARARMKPVKPAEILAWRYQGHIY